METRPYQPVTEVPDGKLLLRINEAAERLSLSRTNLYKLLTNGELESIKVGRSRLIPVDSLEEFVRRYRNNRH
ncbi:MAG: helix-turn-helix domain-containing protein [Pseudomonadota bacterium]